MANRAGRAGSAAGLVDVAHAGYESPLGELTIYVTDRGLVRLAYPGEPREDQLAELAALVSPRIMRAPRRTDAVRRQLDEYFAGERRAFEVAVDWRLIRGFAERVLRRPRASRSVA